MISIARSLFSSSVTFYGNGCYVIEGDAIEPADKVELRLRVTTPAVMANSAEKRHSGKKKITAFERGDRQKQLDASEKNITQSTDTGSKLSTLVSYYSIKFSCNDEKQPIWQRVNISMCVSALLLSCTVH